MKKLDVSVVMAVYNSAPYLRESVYSILAQTLKNLELVAVDDGSTDNTYAILQDLQRQDKRLIVLNQENKGRSHALNRAIEHSRGSFIARMDADDIAYSRRLELQYNYLVSNSHIKGVGTWMRIFPQKRLNIIPITYKNPQHSEILRIHSLFEPPMYHPTVMLDRCVFENMQGPFYNEQLSRAQDYDLWTRLQKKYDFANLAYVGLKYRMHNLNRSSDNMHLKFELAKQSRARALQNIGISLDKDKFETLCSLPLYTNKLQTPGRKQLFSFESLFCELLRQSECLKLSTAQIGYIKSRLSWIWFRLCCFASNNEAVLDIYRESKFCLPGIYPKFCVFSSFFS